MAQVGLSVILYSGKDGEGIMTIIENVILFHFSKIFLSEIHMDEQSLQLLYRFEEDIVENHLRENTLTEQQSIGGTIEHISER